MSKKRTPKPSWTMMLAEDTRADAEQRVRKEHPDVAAVLDFMSSEFRVYDGHGWTVFTDWILNHWEKALKRAPPNLRMLREDTIYNAVFPSLY